MKRFWMFLVISVVFVSGFMTAAQACGGDKSHAESSEGENTEK